MEKSSPKQTEDPSSQEIYTASKRQPLQQEESEITQSETSSPRFNTQGHKVSDEEGHESNYRKSTLQKFTKEVFIEHLYIDSHDERDTHVYYIILVKGRTKYLTQKKVGLSDTDTDNLSDFQSVAQYYVQKRYSELLTFHKLVVAEMKSYLKKKNLPLTDFPEFPGKKLFFNKDQNFVQKRISKINGYFEEIFSRYPNKIPYTNAIIDLCLPFKLNAVVIGQKGSCKTSYIEAVVQLLSEKYNLTERQDGAKISEKKSVKSSKSDVVLNLKDQISSQNDSQGFTETRSQEANSKLSQASQFNLQRINMNIPATLGNSSCPNQASSGARNKYNFSRNGSRQGRRLVKQIQKRERSQDPQTTLNIVPLQKGAKSSTSRAVSSIQQNMSPRKIESYFPFDVNFQGLDSSDQLLFRLDIEEYQASDADIRSIISSVMQAEDKNAIIFTFDMMNIASYERFLKRALKAFIYEREQLPESLKHRRHIPFMVLGMKKDMISKSKIVQEEVASLIRVMKEYVKCDFLYISTFEQEDILESMKCLFSLADGVYCQTSKVKKVSAYKTKEGQPKLARV